MIVPNDAGFGFGTDGSPLAPLRYPPPKYLFLMASPLNRVWYVVLQQLKRIRDHQPKLNMTVIAFGQGAYEQCPRNLAHGPH